jgi:hypothetical protein
LEQRLVGKAAEVIGQDQFAVAMLYFLVIGDRIVLEGEDRDDNERRNQQRGGEVERFRSSKARRQECHRSIITGL